jgi:hypothetical protein
MSPLGRPAWITHANLLRTRILLHLSPLCQKADLHSEDFTARRRVRPEDLRRHSPLTSDRVVLTICGNMQTTYADEMIHVLKRLDGDEFDMVEQPDSSAFPHARRKLEPTAFVELNSLVLELSAQRFGGHLGVWRGCRIVGLDGSMLQLPYTPEIRAAFDPKCGEQAIPHARISASADVLNGIVIGSVIARMQVARRLPVGRQSRSPCSEGPQHGCADPGGGPSQAELTARKPSTVPHRSQ